MKKERVVYLTRCNAFSGEPRIEVLRVSVHVVTDEFIILLGGRKCQKRSKRNTYHDTEILAREYIFRKASEKVGESLFEIASSLQQLMARKKARKKARKLLKTLKRKKGKRKWISFSKHA